MSIIFIKGKMPIPTPRSIKQKYLSQIQTPREENMSGLPAQLRNMKKVSLSSSSRFFSFSLLPDPWVTVLCEKYLESELFLGKARH